MDELMVGLRLMRVRQNSGFTQEEVAEKAQLNLDDYVAMEEGKGLNDKDRLQRACAALDIKIQDLFDTNSVINYGENSGEGSTIGFGYYTNNTFGKCSVNDSGVIEGMAKNLKYVSENLDFINGFVKVLYENLEDTVFKNKLKELLKEHNKGMDKK